MQFDIRKKPELLGEILQNNPELLGAIGWLNKIKDFMKKRLPKNSFPKLYKLADNTRVIENMHREYMSLLASGYKKADILSGIGDFVKWNRQTYTMSNIISDRTNLPKLLILNFFLAMYQLARAGEIPFEKWNPEEFEKSKKLQKSFATEKGFLEKTGEKASKITKILMPLSIGAGIVTALIMWQKKG